MKAWKEEKKIERRGQRERKYEKGSKDGRREIVKRSQ